MRRKLIVPILLLPVLVACATFQQNTYRSLYTAGTSYDLAMTTVSTLQKQGIISEAQRKEINVLANVYYVAYQTSVTAFETYKMADTSANKDKVLVALQNVFSKWREFSAYVNRIRPSTLPPEIEEVK